MTSDLWVVLGLALISMLNPSLVAATTVMLLLPQPKALMLGYLLGAYTTAITVGLVIVFKLQGSSFADGAKRTISPAESIALGAILVVIALVLQTGRDEPVRERRQRRKEAKAKEHGDREPWTQRMLGRGSITIAFAVGAVLSFPGVSYLTALARIAKVDPGTVPTVLLVVGFVLVQLIPLEVPLIGYAVAPERTEHAIGSFRAWLRRRGRRVAIVIACALGVILIVRGVTGAW
jgi:Sap-like sulfolipid-1-addressing protein